MSTLTVAACQMVSTPRVDENLKTADRLIGEAAAAGAKWVGLPEYFCLMGLRDGDKVAAREPFDGDIGSTGDVSAQSSAPIQAFLADAARRHGVWLAGGTLPLVAPSPDKVLNTTLVFAPNGKRAARYDKIHLFGFTKGDEHYQESRTITPGDSIAVAETPFGRIGLSICYDLRFPELYRAMGRVSLMMVPAAFTYTTGRAHWEILLRARAIENQCYVLAPAQGGTHENGRRTWGHSMLVDPWGEIVAERSEDGEGVVVGEVDFDHIARVRESLPALDHRTM